MLFGNAQPMPLSAAQKCRRLSTWAKGLRSKFFIGLVFGSGVFYQLESCLECLNLLKVLHFFLEVMLSLMLFILNKGGYSLLQMAVGANYLTTVI